MSLRLFVASAFAIVVAVVAPRPANAGEPADPPPPARRTSLAFRVAGGATSLRLLDLSFTGGQALFGVSTEGSEHFSLGADLEYARAATANGLLMQVGRLDVTPTFVLGRVRLGLGGHLMGLVITRETGGSDIGKLGFGLHASASLDLVRLGDRSGIFLAIKPSIAKVGPTGLLAGDLVLGLRL